MNELDKNYILHEESFMYELKNMDNFNKTKLNLLIDNLVKVIKDYSINYSNVKINLVIVENAFKLFSIYELLLTLINSHYDINCSYVIRNFDEYNDYEIIHRLRFVIFSILTKEDYSRILDYEDELGKLAKE